MAPRRRDLANKASAESHDQLPTNTNQQNIWQRDLHQEIEKRKAVEAEVEHYKNLCKHYARQVSNMEKVVWKMAAVKKENRDAARAGRVEEEVGSSFNPARLLQVNGMCTRCKNQMAMVVVLPCDHLCFCLDCDNGSDDCSICHTHRISSYKVKQVQ